MQGDLLTPYLKEEEIQKKVANLGKKLGEELSFERPPIFICVLNGASFFFADLIRQYPYDCEIDFISCSSYGSSMKSSGEVKLNYDLSLSVKDRDIILIEDIIDTGFTLEFLTTLLKIRKPKSLTTVSLLEKPDALKADVKVDYSCFQIKKEFVVGYGLDFNNQYRHKRDISILTNTQMN